MHSGVCHCCRHSGIRHLQSSRCVEVALSCRPAFCRMDFLEPAGYEMDRASLTHLSTASHSGLLLRPSTAAAAHRSGAQCIPRRRRGAVLAADRRTPQATSASAAMPGDALRMWHCSAHVDRRSESAERSTVPDPLAHTWLRLSRCYLPRPASHLYRSKTALSDAHG